MVSAPEAIMSEQCDTESDCSPCDNEFDELVESAEEEEENDFDNEDEEAMLFDLIAEINKAGELKQLRIWKGVKVAYSFLHSNYSNASSSPYSLEQPKSSGSPTSLDRSLSVLSVNGKYERSKAARFVRQLLENEETYAAIVQANMKAILPLMELALSGNTRQDALSEAEQKLLNEVLKIRGIPEFG